MRYYRLPKRFRGEVKLPSLTSWIGLVGKVQGAEGAGPISTLTLWRSGEIRLAAVNWWAWWSCRWWLFFIRAKVGVIGMVFVPLLKVGAVVGVALWWCGLLPLAAANGEEAWPRLTVFSAFTRCLCCEGGVAGGIVAAVHVSVTGQSSDLILMPCCITGVGGSGGGCGPLEIEADELFLFVATPPAFQDPICTCTWPCNNAT